MYCLVYMYIFYLRVKEICSSYPWICLTKKKRPLVVFIYLMDFITDQGWGARANSKARNRLSDKNFVFIDNFYFTDSARF